MRFPSIRFSNVVGFEVSKEFLYNYVVHVTKTIYKKVVDVIIRYEFHRISSQKSYTFPEMFVYWIYKTQSS